MEVLKPDQALEHSSGAWTLQRGRATRARRTGRACADDRAQLTARNDSAAAPSYNRGVGRTAGTLPSLPETTMTPRSRLLALGLAGLLLGAGLAGESAAQTPPRPIYGSQLMTPHERQAYRERMREARTARERERIRLEHHRQMQERAREHGVRLPDMPRGPGPGPGYGAGRGAGPGPGPGPGGGPGGGRR